MLILGMRLVTMKMIVIMYTPQVTSFCDKSWGRSLRTRLPGTTPELWNGQWKQKQRSQASTQLSVVGEGLVSLLMWPWWYKFLECADSISHNVQPANVCICICVHLWELVSTCVRMSGVKTGSQNCPVAGYLRLNRSPRVMVVEKDVEGLGEWTLGEVKTERVHTLGSFHFV